MVRDRSLSTSRLGNYYLYSFDGKLLQMYDVYGVLLKDYIYMGDRLIAEYDHVGSRYLYYTPDQINSTRVVTDDTGTVVYSAAHDPYGGIQQTWVNTFDPTPKFSGKERDAESQLDYFGARYYDYAQYRFISVDPITSPNLTIGDHRRSNLYAYCVDNPVNYLDIDGAEATKIQFTLTRLYLKDDLIIGQILSSDLNFRAATLEPLYTHGKRGSSIPDGTYNATPTTYLGNFALDLNFEGRHVYIHFGSSRWNTVGCIIIGKYYDENTKKIIGSAMILMIMYEYCYSRMMGLQTSSLQASQVGAVMDSFYALEQLSYLTLP